MKVVGYISSNKIIELERSFELQAQKKKLSAFCLQKELSLIKIYEESSDSREDYKPILLRLMKDSAIGKFNKLVITDFDILSKDKSIINWIIRELKHYNVTISSIKDLSLKEGYLVHSLERLKCKVKNKVREIGSLPEVVTKVSELVQNPKSSAAQLSKVISHDPGLTSKVLKLVNSAYYGFPKQISSIQHAIMILGFTTMRGLVLSSSIYKIFTPKNTNIVSLDYKKLWMHLLITAIISKKISNYLGIKENDDLFSAAILHDIGKIILDQYDHENYIQVLHQLKKSSVLGGHIALEEKFCGASHQEIGYILAEEWNLPESLANVIRFHHNPLGSEDYTQLVSIVYTGNILTHIVMDKLTFNMNMFSYEVLDFLGITEDGLLFLLEEILGEIDEYNNMDSFLK